MCETKHLAVPQPSLDQLICSAGSAFGNIRSPVRLAREYLTSRTLDKYNRETRSKGLQPSCQYLCSILEVVHLVALIYCFKVGAARWRTRDTGTS